MSRAEELRRPLRVVPASEVAQPQRQAAATPAVDRFRRTLAGSRRDAPAAEPRAPLNEARQNERPPQSLPAALERDPSLLGVAQDLAAVATEDDPLWQDPPRQKGDESGVAVPLAGAFDKWAEDTTQKIVTLCRRADPAFVNWTVTVPMDPQTLPDTELVLSMSQHGLSLRFRTQSPQSVQLIAAHKHRLRALLERTRGLPHGIDIETV